MATPLHSVVYGPFYNGPRDMGLIVPSTLQHMLPCNVGSPKMDQVSPGLLANMIWTWAPGQPANPVNRLQLSSQVPLWH